MSRFTNICDGCNLLRPVYTVDLLVSQYADICKECLIKYNYSYKLKCTCGAESTKQPGHSIWCDKDGL